MCSLNVNFQSTLIPRCLTDSVGKIICLLIFKFIFILHVSKTLVGIFLDLPLISYLETILKIFLYYSLVLLYIVLSKIGSKAEIALPSAKLRTSLINNRKSLIKMLNKVGPSTDPWGTLSLIFCQISSHKLVRGNCY